MKGWRLDLKRIFEVPTAVGSGRSGMDFIRSYFLEQDYIAHKIVWKLPAKWIFNAYSTNLLFNQRQLLENNMCLHRHMIWSSASVSTARRLYDQASLIALSLMNIYMCFICMDLGDFELGRGLEPRSSNILLLQTLNCLSVLTSNGAERRINGLRSFLFMLMLQVNKVESIVALKRPKHFDTSETICVALDVNNTLRCSRS